MSRIGGVAWAGRAVQAGPWLAAATALCVRLAVVAWAASRFPPAGDGTYYDTLARRIAEGHGYTWLWPDGAVTSVAHYPVGYPAMLALVYFRGVRSAAPSRRWSWNALFGAAMASAVYGLFLPSEGPSRSEDAAPRAWATAAAVAVGIHPALVPYTAAVMTEGVATALVVVAVASARGRFHRAWLGWGIAGLALGVATLVRPQCLAFAPLLGFLAPVAPAPWAVRTRAAAVVVGIALATCAPWTARNCIAMNKCALVSVNGGWNLLIGTQTNQGAWQPVDVPEVCRAVWDEAGKDDCFARAAHAAIARDPLAWVGRTPAKLAATFDYFGGGPWYLHASNPGAFGERAKVVLGALETVVSYLFLLVALARVALAEGPRRSLRVGLTASGAALAAVLVHGWVAYLALAAAILAFGPRWLARAPIIVAWTAILILATAATHAVFFGAGRYGLVVVPFVTALAFLPRGDRSAGPA